MIIKLVRSLKRIGEEECLSRKIEELKIDGKILKGRVVDDKRWE